MRERPNRTGREPMSPDLLILTTGGSGSYYIHRVLWELDYHIGHMRGGDHGTVGPQMIFNRPWHQRIHLMRGECEWARIVHQVRHPLKVVASIRWFRSHIFRWCRFMESMPKRFRPDKDECRMAFWFEMNKEAARVAEWSYRIEDLTLGGETWQKFIVPLGFHPDTPLPYIPRNINTRARGRVYTWDDIKSPMLRSEVQDLARSFGYDV